MANTISSLQMYAPKSWSGLTTENHLGSVFAQEPTLVSNIISRSTETRKRDVCTAAKTRTAATHTSS